VAAGVYKFTIQAVNGISPNATQPFTLTVISSGTTVSLQFKGSINYKDSGLLTSGGFTVSTAYGIGYLWCGSTITAVTGTGTIPGLKGGLATITVSIHRIGCLYIGFINVVDPGAHLKTTALVRATSLTRIGANGLSGTAYGAFYVLDWTV
jgi:hypothetical protein